MARLSVEVCHQGSELEVTKMNEKNPFRDAPVVFSYTRAQAIEDGVLLDMTEWGRETGFRFPVACTAAVWHEYIVPPAGTEKLGQTERGGAHDMLWMLYNTIRGNRSDPKDQLLFKVLFLNAAGKHEEVTLKAHCGPGDYGEPVVTIMLPDED
jgi:hypothetical protein